MTGLITEKQLKYLNILLVENLGEQYRKTYLKIFWNVDSSKDLTKEQAHQIIEMFIDENPEREKNKAVALNKIYEALGQRKLFDWIVD